MNKSIQYGFLFLLTIVSVLFIPGCNKENTTAFQSLNSISIYNDTSSNTSIKDTCSDPTMAGRIIGFNPLMSFLNFDTSRFTKYDSALGPGYLIEIVTTAKKDTVICYRMVTNHFQFKPLRNNIASLYLFNQEYQDSLKIKFNYQIMVEKTEIKTSADTYMEHARYSIWLNFIKDKKEIRMSCVSQQ